MRHYSQLKSLINTTKRDHTRTTRVIARALALGWRTLFHREEYNFAIIVVHCRSKLIALRTIRTNMRVPIMSSTVEKNLSVFLAACGIKSDPSHVTAVGKGGSERLRTLVVGRGDVAAPELFSGPSRASATRDSL